MNINGIDINTQALGEGLYRIICDQGREAIVAFGMLPADLMRTVEQQTKDKIKSIMLKQHGMEWEEFKAWKTGSHGEASKMIADSIQETVDAIAKDAMHQVALAIYAAAKHAGKMVV